MSPSRQRTTQHGRRDSTEASGCQVYRELADRLNEVANTIFFQLGADFKGLAPGVHGFVHMADIITRYKNISLG